VICCHAHGKPLDGMISENKITIEVKSFFAWKKNWDNDHGVTKKCRPCVIQNDELKGLLSLLYQTNHSKEWAENWVECTPDKLEVPSVVV